MRLIPGFFGGSGCARFEKAILLSISGDLAGRPARAIAVHLERCAGCRESLARARKLRERCLEVASGRRYELSSRWAAIAAELDEVPARCRSQIGSSQIGASPTAAPGPSLETPAWAGGRRRAWLRVGLPLSIAAAILCLLTPLIIHRQRGPEQVGRTVLDSRWSKEWDEFVSGSESRGEINLDPFAQEIPNPEVIDF
jgi:hypothetical protein